jgi:pimeloyl-ACP methyl ester carboxylesterase
MIRIAWESHGSGEALLMIQGLGYGRWGWDPVLPGLATRYRVLTFDNRGIGESDKPEGPYTAELMARDALQVLDEAGVERAHVLGASLGGMIAQEVAAAAPDRVDKLVLCCTTPGGAGAVPIPEVTLRLLAESASLAPEIALRLFIENALAAPPDEGLVDELLRRRLANPPDPQGWQAQAGAGATFPGIAGSILAPTLVLQGTEDNVVDYRNADLLAAVIPGASVRLFPGTGHLFFWERSGEVVAAVTEFLG